MGFNLTIEGQETLTYDGKIIDGVQASLSKIIERCDNNKDGNYMTI